MKLYEIPRNSQLIIEGMHITFYHIDGMYSYCTTSDGSVVHLRATSEWKKVDDHYEFVDDEVRYKITELGEAYLRSVKTSEKFVKDMEKSGVKTKRNHREYRGAKRLIKENTPDKSKIRKEILSTDVPTEEVPGKKRKK